MGTTHGYKTVPIPCPYGYGTRGYPYPWVKLPSLLPRGHFFYTNDINVLFSQKLMSEHRMSRCDILNFVFGAFFIIVYAPERQNILSKEWFLYM
jgi:hypothetical protein